MISAFGVDHGTISKAKKYGQPGEPEAGARFGQSRKMAKKPKYHQSKLPFAVPSKDEVAVQHARRTAQAAYKAGRQDRRIGQLARGSFKRRALKPLLQPKGMIGAAAGTTALVELHRHPVHKSHRATNAALGSVAGAGVAGAVSDIGGQTLKARLKDRRARRGESPREAKIWAEHKRSHGVSGAVKSGMDAQTKKAIFRSYPKELPDALGHRLLARKNPKLIMATGAVAGAAYGAHRHVQKNVELHKATRDQKEEAGAAVAGGGAGALAAPGRRINRGGRHVHPDIANLPEGLHYINPAHLQRHTQGTGFRFGDRAHVAHIAQNIQRNGYDESKPVGLTLWHDRGVVTDGNHRVHGTATAGHEKIPVQIRRGAGQSPADQPRIAQLYDYFRGTRQRKGYVKQRNNQAWIDRNAKKVVKPDSMRGKINARVSEIGSAKAPRAAKTLSRGKYVATNAALIGGGAAVAGGLMAAHNRHERSLA